MISHKAAIEILIEEKQVRETFILEAEECLKNNPDRARQAKKVIDIIQRQIKELDKSIILLTLDEEKI